MSTFAPAKVEYPYSDGKPMAESTEQYECIVTLQLGLDALLSDFVGADNFWYPVEGNPHIVVAPDVYVAVGRPKGHRKSFMQWKEGGVAPQVVFEVISKGNSLKEMKKKLAFYQRYGVEEFYHYNPSTAKWVGYTRQGNKLVAVADMGTHVSARTGIRFDTSANYMRVIGPDGQEFQPPLEEKRRRHEAEAALTEAERRNAELIAKLRAAGLDPDA